VIYYLLAIHAAIDHLPLLAPDPSPPPAGNVSDTVVNFDRLKKIGTFGVAPVLGVFIGISILALANTGQMSRVTKIALIAMVGLGFVGGATVLMAIGEPAMRAVFGK
jgi:hypothetical protein